MYSHAYLPQAGISRIVSVLPVKPLYKKTSKNNHEEHEGKSQSTQSMIIM